MPFVMTKETDVVDVQVEIDGEVAFTLKVGVIPNEIGDKINELAISNTDLLKAQTTGDDEAILEALGGATEAVNEITRLYMKYGVRGLEGPEFADGSPVPCTIETEEGTNFKVLSDETLKLYMANKQLLSLASKNVAQIATIGIGKYKKGGYKTVDEARKDLKLIPLAASSALSSKS